MASGSQIKMFNSFFYFPSLSITDFFLHSLGSKVYVRPLILALIRHAKFHWLPFLSTGCSGQNCVFPGIFCLLRPLLSPALGCFLSFRKWRANRSDCTLPLPWRSQRYVSEVGLRWIVIKTQFFLNTLYLTSQLVLHTLRMARIWHFGSTSTGYFVHLLVCPSDMKISSLSATEHRSSGRVFIFTKSVNTNRLTPQTFRPINCYSNGYVL